MTDDQLLQTFIDHRDEASFEALVRRHGTMVYAACLRVVGNTHDADDCFQATFLVLARKAGSIVPREMLRRWLYGVACRTALNAKVAIAKKHAREKPMAHVPEPQSPSNNLDHHRLQQLDEELQRLPEKYRLPLLLCDLEGRTQKEAAEFLGWPEGTVAIRLMRGRRKLAARLRQNSLLLFALLGTELTAEATSRLTPSEVLIVSTVKAASRFAAGQDSFSEWVSPNVVALTKGVVNAMALSHVKLQIVTFLLAGLVSLGIGGMIYQMKASEPAGLARQQPSEAEGKDAAPPLHNEVALEGTPGRRGQNNSQVPVGEADVRALNDLLQQFADAEFFWQQGEVASKLIALADPAVIPAMEKHLDGVDRRRRCNAALVLAGLGDRRGLDVIIGEMQDKRPRPTALTRSDGRPYPEGQIRQDRYYAALLLGRLGKKEGVPALIQATTDETVCDRAAISLGEIGDKSAIPALRKMASEFPKQRLWAAYGLAALGESDGFTELADVALSDPTWTMRRHAIDAMGKFRNPKSVSTLVKSLKDEHVNVRVSAAIALGAIGDTSALPALTQALTDSKKTEVNSPTTVAEAAQKAINQIKARSK